MAGGGLPAMGVALAHVMKITDRPPAVMVEGRCSWLRYAEALFGEVDFY